MNKRLYVGNLSPTTTKADLSTCFGQIGRVVEVTLLCDTGTGTGRSRRFGFVEMSDNKAAIAAKSSLDGSHLDGRPIKVEEARPRTPPRLRYPTTW